MKTTLLLALLSFAPSAHALETYPLHHVECVYGADQFTYVFTLPQEMYSYSPPELTLHERLKDGSESAKVRLDNFGVTDGELTFLTPVPDEHAFLLPEALYEWVMPGAYFRFLGLEGTFTGRKNYSSQMPCVMVD